MKPFPWFFLVTLLLLAQGASAADLERSPVPDWVAEKPWSPPPAPQEARGPFESLTKAVQFNLSTQERYIHIAYRPLSASAVQSSSNVSISYYPNYQNVRLHFLRVWKKGGYIDQTDLPFRSLQREANLERLQYDESQDWVGFVRDVQPGDVIEYAYTIVGDNPIYGGRFAKSIPLQGSLPVGQWNLRLIAPLGKTPTIRVLPDPIPATTQILNNREETTWSIENLPSLNTEATTPVDSVGELKFIFSDWKSWEDVVEWALPMYQPTGSPTVTAKAQELTKGLETPEEKALALLQFTQDKIRYLAIEVGVNSHLPRKADEILRNGYGDCKDKVMLFRTLAAEVGIEVCPVLVHSVNGRSVAKEGPTPTAFNHVIAAVAAPSGVIFVDPTISGQGGMLASRALPGYGYGLEIRKGVQDLTLLPSTSKSQSELVQTYVFANYEGEAEVTLDYSYFERSADLQRQWWANLDVVKWRKTLDELLLKEYGGATLLQGPTAADDLKQNTFRISFKYAVKGVWKKNGETLQSEFYPAFVGEILRDPASTTPRIKPYGRADSVTYRQVRKFIFPSEYPAKPSSNTLRGPQFELTSQVAQLDPRTVVFTDTYTPIADRVEPDKWSEHLKALKDARAQLVRRLGLTLTPPDPFSKLVFAGGLVGSVAAGILVFLAAVAAQGAGF